MDKKQTAIEDQVSKILREFDTGCECDWCSTTSCVCREYRLAEEVVRLRKRLEGPPVVCCPP